MLKNPIKIAIENIRRRKFYSVAVVALAFAIFTPFWSTTELFDFHQDASVFPCSAENEPDGNMESITVDEGLILTLGLRLISGRDFDAVTKRHLEGNL